MIKAPLISEKSMNLTKSGFYTFLVGSDATKQTVAKLVAEKFKVDVLNVRMINIAGKKKMQRTRRGFFQTAPLKKAIVKVKKGQKIHLFEAPTEEKEEVVVTTGEGEPIAKTREKKSLLRGTKVKIEEAKASGIAKEETNEKRSRQQAGKTKGGR